MGNVDTLGDEQAAELDFEGLWAAYTDAVKARAAYEGAIEEGERAHLLTVGSPARGIALRVTLGRLNRRGEYRPHVPCTFVIVNGIPYYSGEVRDRAKDRVARTVANWLPDRVVDMVMVRVGAHATTGEHGNTIVPELGFMEAWQRWGVRNVPR